MRKQAWPTLSPDLREVRVRARDRAGRHPFRLPRKERGQATFTLQRSRRWGGVNFIMKRRQAGCFTTLRAELHQIGGVEKEEETTCPKKKSFK